MLEEELISKLLENGETSLQIALLLFLLVRVSQITKKLSYMEGKVETLIEVLNKDDNPKGRT